MGKYTDYVEATLPGRQERLAARMIASRTAADQQIQNISAPTVSGSSGKYNTPTSFTTAAPKGKSSNSSKSSAPAITKKFKNIGNKYNPATGNVTQSWGGNKPNYSAGRHTGVDYGGGHNSKISAAANGVVSAVGRGGSYGNNVRIKHPDGTTTLYAHLASIGVKQGQNVKGGQRIGGMGSTGNSTGTHLHFEVRTRDKYGGDINPSSWFKR